MSPCPMTLLQRGRLALVAAALLVSACTTTRPVAAPDFDAALSAHLAAIAARDLAAYEATLTDADDLYVIFPDGSALTTREAVLDFHKEWFGDADWIMEPKIVKTIVGTDQATVLLEYAYRNAPDADPRQNWLVLVFGLEDGRWVLVHDQNTRIAP